MSIQHKIPDWFWAIAIAIATLGATQLQWPANRIYSYGVTPWIQWFSFNGVQDPMGWGAAGDALFTTGCSMTVSSAVLTCPSNTFSTGNIVNIFGVAKTVYVPGAGSGGGANNLVATIASYTSGTQVNLSTPALATATSVGIVWGTDDTAALNTLVNAVCTNTNGAYCRQKIQMSSGQRFMVNHLNWSGYVGLAMTGATSPNNDPGTAATFVCVSATNNVGICADGTASQAYSLNYITFTEVHGLSPRVQLLLAKNSSGLAGFSYTLDHMAYDGAQTGTGGDFGLYNYGGEQFFCDHCSTFGEFNIAAQFFTSANTPGISSAFQTTQTPPASMTIIGEDHLQASTNVTGVPIMFNPGSTGVISGRFNGYCQSPNGIDCISDYSSADSVGEVTAFNFDFDHEPLGANPGAMLHFYHTNSDANIIRGFWNPAVSSANPAIRFGGAVYGGHIDVFALESIESGAIVICDGANLGLWITDYASTPLGVTGPQANDCAAGETYPNITAGNVMANGTYEHLTGIVFTGPSTHKFDTTNGATFGFALCGQGLQAFPKVASCALSSYQETGAAQTWTFPSAFGAPPILVLSGGSCGAYNPTATATTLTLPANAAMGTESCSIIVMGG